MTALGIVEGVERTLYRDEIGNVNVYPLDEKIELLIVGSRYSRYTGNFASLAAEYYARMPERDALELLEKTLKIELEQDSLTSIGAAVAQPYLPTLCNEAADKEEVLQPATNEPNFLEKRMLEIDTSPNREIILLEALEDGVKGTERKRADADLTVTYVEADGTGVSGLPGELSNQGRNGGAAKTFEVKIGVQFNQSFDSGGLPLLENDRIYRDLSFSFFCTRNPSKCCKIPKVYLLLYFV
jgi:hypothetical protein